MYLKETSLRSQVYMSTLRDQAQAYHAVQNASSNLGSERLPCEHLHESSIKQHMHTFSGCDYVY